MSESMSPERLAELSGVAFDAAHLAVGCSATERSAIAAVPELLAEVRRLQKQLDTMRREDETARKALEKWDLEHDEVIAAGRSFRQMAEQASHVLALAREFRVPFPAVDGRAGYGEVAVVRESADSDQWAVTDGAVTGLRAWVSGRWQYVSDIGRAAAYRYGDIGEALAVAEEAARASQDAFDAMLRAAVARPKS